MLHFYFHGLYRDGEPGAVEGYANETDWARKDINDCIADLDDRECNFRDGDLVDNSIVRCCGTCLKWRAESMGKSWLIGHSLGKRILTKTST